MRNRHKIFLIVSSGIFIPAIVFERLETTFLIISAMLVLFLAEIGLSTAVVFLSNTPSAAAFLNEGDGRTGLRKRTILCNYLNIGQVCAICRLSLAVILLGLSHAVPLLSSFSMNFGSNEPLINTY